MTETKKIHIEEFLHPTAKKEHSMPNKTISKRKITMSSNWNFNEEELSHDKQISYIEQLYNSNVDNARECNMILTLLKQKLSGYSSQDKKKSRFSKDEFVNLEEIIKLLNECKNTCYYCQKRVNILYENVREPTQWSLERISNDKGHNKGNLVIACLHCNVNRKTMNQERFVFTKQLNIIKKE
jgi:hypothetical protein